MTAKFNNVIEPRKGPLLLPQALEDRFLEILSHYPHSILGFEFEPPDPLSIKQASTWIAQFPELLSRETFAYPTSVGTVQCEWVNGTRELDIEFLPDSKITWLAYDSVQQDGPDGEIDTSDPAAAKVEIQKLIDWLLEVQ